MVFALTIIAIAVVCALVVLAAPALTNRPPGGWSRWARAEAAAARRRQREEPPPSARAAVDVPVGGIFTLNLPEEAPVRRPPRPARPVVIRHARRPVRAGGTRHARRG